MNFLFQVFFHYDMNAMDCLQFLILSLFIILSIDSIAQIGPILSTKGELI